MLSDMVEVTARSTSKSALWRTFVERTRQALGELISCQLADLHLAVMMIDGNRAQGPDADRRSGVRTETVKIPLGLWEGSTENAAVATCPAL